MHSCVIQTKSHKFKQIQSLKIPQNCFSIFGWGTDLEKAASGASGACGHFVGNHAILRTFLAKYPILLTKGGGKGVEDG